MIVREIHPLVFRFWCSVDELQGFAESVTTEAWIRTDNSIVSQSLVGLGVKLQGSSILRID